MQKEEDKSFLDEISASDDDEGDNVDADSIFKNISVEKKEVKAEESIVENSIPFAEAAEEKSVKEKTPEKTKEKPQQSPPKEPIPFDSPELVATKGTQKTEKTVEVKARPKVKIVEKGRFNWLLQPPTDKYSSFYAEKADALEYILPGDQIPFGEYTKELISAKVDLNVHDPQTMTDRMAQVQRWKERLYEMLSRVNEQYYPWDRFMEMLRGELARIEPEKNAEARKGVLFQHLRDMELYHTELERLHNDITVVMKNLDSAWETLNRKVTVALADYRDAGRERTVYGNKEQVSASNGINNQNSDQTSLESEDDSEWDSIDLGDSVSKNQGVADQKAQKKDSKKETDDWFDS
jgi:hypothetical protein